MYIGGYSNKMYHPGKYDEHNKSLKRFVDKFNKVEEEISSDIVMEIHKHENFIDDAIIIDKKTDKKLSFDWEKRNTHYTDYGFPFKDFGQFERKIKKPKIELSIQCCKSENGFCIAWHSDFKKEKIKNIGSVTEKGDKEFNGKRFTKKFMELNYAEMEKFHKILRKAFDEDALNCESFDLGEEE